MAEPWLGLFEVIGRRWGGDEERFAVPDLRGAEPNVPDHAGNLTFIIATVGRAPEAA